MGQHDFPHEVYKNTVLAPLFEGVKQHFVLPLQQINKAHLVMLKSTGILQPDQCAQIATALSAIEQDLADSNPQYTGEHEDYFFLVESELKRVLGADLGGMLHTARSRNDMDHTLFKMRLRVHADKLLIQSLALADALLEKAAAERDTLIVAYTHGQPAQPSTFGHYLCAALEVLIRDIARLREARIHLDHCPMGAAAITTSGFPIDRHQMADLLGFEGVLLNSYGCIASVDYVTGLYSAMKLMFLHLGRLIQDFQFWTAFEVGQLHIPDSLVQVSSIMPQKRNPVPVEHLRHLASTTCGRCDGIVNTMHNTPFADMNDSEGEVQIAGYAAFDSGGRVLELLAALVSECAVQSDRVAVNSDRACITVTELADTLVRTEKLSFRQSHEIAASTASCVIAAGLPLAQGFDAFCTAFEKSVSRVPSLGSDEYARVVSARHFVQVRSRPGGPAPEMLDQAMADYRKQIAAELARVQSSLARSAQSSEHLQSAFEELKGLRD